MDALISSNTSVSAVGPDQALPLGAIVLWDVGRGGGMLLPWEVWPWCPIVVVLNGYMESRSIELLRQARGQLGYVNVKTAEPAAIVAAVAKRPRPTAAHLLEYVTRRIRIGTAIGELQQAMADVARPPASYRSACRHLAQLGPYGPRDWRVVAQLARVGALGISNVEDLARQHECQARTLRSRVREYLDTTVDEFRRRAGWEWVLEAALRAGGYVRTCA